MDIKPTLMAKSHYVAAISLAVVLAACGGGGGGGGNTPDDNGGENTAEVRMGSLSGRNFVNGAVEIANNDLVAGASSAISVDFVDQEGALITAVGYEVTFSSTCVTAGTASLGNASVTSSGGTASTIYTVGEGCSESDVITATATVTGETLSATGNVTMTPVRMGSLVGTTFTAETVEIADNQLVANQSSAVSVDFVDSDGNLITGSDFEVIFSSTCATAGTASFDNAEVTSVGGIATAIYTVEVGCNESDEIKATAVVSGSTLSATGDITMTPIRMGSLVGSNFTENLAEMSISSLVAGSSAEVRIDFVDSDGVLISNTDFDVTFSSSCSDASQGSFVPTSVTSVGGTASTMYTPGFACTGTDIITATATIEGANFVATKDLAIGVPDFSSDTIEYVSSDPESIFLAGSGGIERSTVTFLVKDDDGQPAEGRTVDFVLDSTGSGASVINSSDISDEDGLVTVVVRAGNSPTPLVVRASIHGTAASTQSRQLTVGTGVSDRNHFSIAATILNVDAFNRDGQTSSLTTRLADRFGNPVPDGTPITFTTEGGSITPSCTTTNGACSVTWTGQAPRAGVAQILAVTNGNESFIDADGDGLFDDVESFTDLPEPFRDDNEDGNYDVGEFFDDENLNGVWDDVDGTFTGTSCATGATTCSGTVRHISQSLTLNMSDGTRQPQIDDSGIPGTITGDFSALVTLADFNGNALPNGTTISVAAGKGTLLFPTSTITIGNTLSPSALLIIFSEGTATGTGLLTITVDMPNTAAYVFPYNISL